jgi:hypothetical protein
MLLFQIHYVKYQILHPTLEPYDIYSVNKK